MSTGKLREFEINIINLENRLHKFEFEFSSGFFESFPLSIIEKGKGSIQLELNKSETMMVLHFKIDASIELTCDISLEKFDFPVLIDQDLMIKFGEETIELSEDMIMIQLDTQSINVSEYVYQFLNLHVPMKKVHPNLEGKERPDIVYKSEDKTDQKEGEIDPRWEVLKKLKK